MTTIEGYSQKTADPRQMSFDFRTTDIVIIALGSHARQGKDECARTIYAEHSLDHGGKYNILISGFADALRAEVNADMHRVQMEHKCSPREALAHLCWINGVVYDPEAEADKVYEFGKQRALLQIVGQKRREQDTNYWINKWWANVQDLNPRVVLCPDLRFPNEMEFIKAHGGHTVKVRRMRFAGLTPKDAAHISETALDGAKFDYLIQVKDGQLDPLRHKALNLFEKIMETN